MFLVFMRRVFVLMAAVLPGVLMVMYMGITGMGMLMGMLMNMLMFMRVLMLMRMFFLTVDMLMAVHVRMFVGMQMFVFVLAFHKASSCKNPLFPWDYSEVLF